MHYAFNREKEACCSLKLTAACSLLGQVKYLSDRTRTDLTGMLAYLFACIGKIMQICSEFDAKGVTQAHTHTHHKSTLQPLKFHITISSHIASEQQGKIKGC